MRALGLISATAPSPRLVGGIRIRLVAFAFAGFLVVSLLTRLVLLLRHRAFTVDGLGACLRAVGVGTLYDALAAVWVLAPLAAFLALVPERLMSGRWARGALLVGLTSL